MFSYTTALAIVLEREGNEDLHDKIQAVREPNDKGFARWPIHINFLFPFIPLDGLEHLRMDLNSVEQFTLHLKRIDYFEHNKKMTIFLEPTEPSGALQTIFQKVAACFPEVAAKAPSAEKAAGFTPHMTIATPSTAGKGMARAARDLLRSLQSDWEPASFRCSGLCMLSRPGGDPSVPFRVVQRIPFAVENPVAAPSLRANTTVETGLRRAYQRLPTFRFVSGHWTPILFTLDPASGPDEAVLPPAVSADSLRFLTYNVMFDFFEDSAEDSEARTNALIALLSEEHESCDVILLQEVTIPFLRLLLQCDWVQSLFYVSDGPSGSSLTPYGQITLSRFPFRSSLLLFKGFSRKRVSVAHFLHARAGLTCVYNVHLTSGVGRVKSAQRLAQLDVIFGCCAADSDPSALFLCAGDFNFGDGDRADQQALARTVDAWTAVHQFPAQPGHTFDPTTNSAAAKTSQSAIPRRLDRVLIYGKEESVRPACRPVSAHLVGHGAIPSTAYCSSVPSSPLSVCPSDHYGVFCVLSFEPATREELDQLDTATCQWSRDVAREITNEASAKDVGSSPFTLPNATPDLDAALFPEKSSQCQDMWDNEPSSHQETFELLSMAVSDCLEQLLITTCANLPADCVILPLGSTALRTTDRCSDLDVLVCSFLDRDTVFNDLPSLLAVWSNPGSDARPPIGVIQVIQDTTASLIRLLVNETTLVDLTYCMMPPKMKQRARGEKTPQPEKLIEQLMVCADKCLLDEQSSTALNGLLDIKLILAAIPPARLQLYRSLVRSIKQWARSRSLYAGKTGYLNGLAIAIMCASTVRTLEEPHSSMEKVVIRFFEQYGTSDRFPTVNLRDGSGVSSRPSDGSGVSSRPSGRILFPVFAPSTGNCVLRSVTSSSVFAMIHAFHHAHSVLTSADPLNLTNFLATPSSPAVPISLAQSYVIQVLVSAPRQSTAAQFVRWTSFVHNRLSGLCKRVEQRALRAGSSVVALVWPQPATDVHTADTDNGFASVFSVGLAQDDLLPVDNLGELAAEAAADFELSVSSWAEKTPTMLLAVSVLSGADARSCAVRAAGLPTAPVVSSTERRVVEEFATRATSLLVQSPPTTPSEKESKATVTPPPTVKRRRATKQLVKDEERALADAMKRKKDRRLTPAIEIMNRVRFDPSLDAYLFDLVFVDRFLGDVRVKLLEFDFENIPTHRIKEFYMGRHLCWSKDTRFIDKSIFT